MSAIAGHLAAAHATTQLPDGWRLARLDDLCEPRTGVRDPREQPDTSFRYVDISSVDNARKRITEAKTILGKDAPSRARQIIRAGDVLVATTRPNLNAVALVPPELDGEICSTGFCVLRPKAELHGEFLFAFVQHPAFVRRLSDMVKGALYPAVTDAQVRSLRIPLPPLAEQRRIVAVLAEKLAAVEKARAAADHRLNIARLLPQAVLRSLFRGQSARAWPVRRLDRVCHIIMGQSPNGSTCNREGHGVPLLNGPTEFGKDHPTPAQWTSDPTRFAEPGDILFCVRGATTGRMNVADRRYCIGRGLAAFRGRDGVAATSFLRCVLEYATPDLLAKTAGSTFPNLPGSEIASFESRFPPLEEQESLAEKFDICKSQSEAMARSAEEELTAIASLRTAILRRAFQGGL